MTHLYTCGLMSAFKNRWRTITDEDGENHESEDSADTSDEELTDADITSLDEIMRKSQVIQKLIDLLENIQEKLNDLKKSLIK